ncbi:hypothetical protein Rhopal_000637-T1 [Rhodotorula paludigena]|uniref:Tethering factor for nuclear proteasome STS1 n=1 Tax=Rhodotorula paludigena TaxID=86838 RepID=A0AAV5GF47_9BASI|nr:hypothetical protein Rhopal_000637-T1 [Rhodotorula paludigena]
MQYTHGSYQQPVQTLPSSPFSQPHLLASPSHAPSSPVPSFAHGVAFGSIPGSQPGVLGWGVGMSAANGGGFGFGARAASGGAGGGGAGAARSQTPSSVGWGSASTSAAAQQARPASPSPSAAQPNSRRRRRSASPGMSSDDDEGGASARGAGEPRAIRPMQSFGAKRARRAPSGPDAAGAAAPSGLGGGAAVVGDLGKALASLDKPALLNVFSRLLTTNPQLAPTIAALLPTPSLATILDTLSSLERAVVTATPTGAFLRDEYIWSRVRVPLEEFVSESRRFLGLFVPAQAPTGVMSEDNLAHPSTAFQFLDALTHALVRLEATLPSSASQPTSTSTNPLAAHLVPLTLNAWHLFLTRLADAVNAQGKVLPTSLVRTWFDKVAHVCAPPPSSVFGAASAGAGARPDAAQVRRAMEGVRDRMRREIGWLVGIRPENPAGGAGMEGVEEEEL